MPMQHIANFVIHKFMLEIEKKYQIPPCNDLSAYLSMLQSSGLVNSQQAQEIENHYDQELTKQYRQN